MRMMGVAVAVMVAAASGVGLALAPAPHQGAAVKEFEVVAERFKFTPDHLVVNQGDTVRLTVRSADGTHGFQIKKLKVDTKVPKGGKQVAVEFVADKAGEFPITCSEYCGRGHSHMKAMLEVLPAAGQGGSK